MIRDWDKSLVAVDVSLSPNQILEILDNLNDEDAASIINEYLAQHEKCMKIVEEWLKE